MSRIWTLCAGQFEPRGLAGRPWRAVEDQHVNSTRKLVDSDDEQAALERRIDQVKPPWPSGERWSRWHYLLATPFRYPPLPYGSRFGERHERGIFYAAKTRETVMAEKAYYVLLFLDGTQAAFEPLTRPLTLFQVSVAATRGADLTRPPFAEFEAQISAKTSYADSQPLGSELRRAGIQACRYRSARDPTAGVNWALFEPVFRSAEPLLTEHWICTATRARVEFKPGLAVRGARRHFERSTFEIEGALPTPGVRR